MKRKSFALLVVSLLFFSVAGLCPAGEEPPKSKQTELGLYATAAEVHAKWVAAPDSVRIVDVRTPGEYVFVGHAPTAVNIPIRFFKEAVDPQTVKPVMPLNERFVEEVKARFKETDTLFVMCRSGGRSAFAVNALAKAGFRNAYNVVDGFEGDKLNDPDSDNNGKRIVNGWRNAGAPWTYALDAGLVYSP